MVHSNTDLKLYYKLYSVTLSEERRLCNFYFAHYYDRKCLLFLYYTYHLSSSICNLQLCFHIITTFKSVFFALIWSHRLLTFARMHSNRSHCIQRKKNSFIYYELYRRMIEIKSMICKAIRCFLFYLILFDV